MSSKQYRLDALLEELQSAEKYLKDYYKNNKSWIDTKGKTLNARAVDRLLSEAPEGIRTAILIMIGDIWDLRYRLDEEYIRKLLDNTIAKDMVTPYLAAIICKGDFQYKHIASDIFDDSNRFFEAALLILRNAPRDSAALGRLFFKLLNHELPPTVLGDIRTAWRTLDGDERRSVRLWLERYYSNSGKAAKRFEQVNRQLERLVGMNDERFYPRWIDTLIGNIRLLFWECLEAAERRFAEISFGLGDERGQLGGLITSILMAMHERRKDIERYAKEKAVDFELAHYVFPDKSEKEYGADFAVLFCVESKGEISFSRFITVQAKLIKSGKARIDTNQLKNILRGSWHSSFYCLWGPGMLPNVISAALLSEHKKISRSSAVKPVVNWEDMRNIADRFSALLGDRLLRGELGDPLISAEEGDVKSSNLAEHLIRVIGHPKHGILTIVLVKGSGQISTEGLVRIGIEPQIIASSIDKRHKE